MGRSQESFNKKEVRKKKEKKRLDKEKKRQARKEADKKGGLDDMIAYVDEFGNITSTPPDPDTKEGTKAEDIEVSVPKQDPNQAHDTERQGIVSYFNESKGYGFIKDPDTGDSFFVHLNDIEEEIAEGNRVSFESVKGQKGPAAIRVKPIR
jgi:cold shock CspA family protein